MCEEITLSFPVSTFEELRCFLCKGYLSCSPVRLLPNGQNICGRCSPLNTDTPIYRLVAFEAVLNKMSFPCVFKKYGCSETLLFGKTIEHESKCVHKPVACPTNTNADCSWEGTASQLLQHFKDAHPRFVKERLEFQLALNEDVQGFLMATENVFAFIVKYIYKAKERVLQYDLRCCGGKNEYEVSWQMQLINSIDSDCQIRMKSNKCCLYDESIYNIDNAKVLDVSKFLEPLSDPDSIVVALKLKFIKSNGLTADNNLEVNFDVIKNLKCFVCRNYLVPPVFELTDMAICYDCSKTRPTCKPSHDPNLLKRVDEAIYPCRWRECNFVGKSNIFRDHEMNCEFRIHRCVYSNCEITFKRHETVDHLIDHLINGNVYLPDKITYKTSFSKEYAPKDILTMLDNKIILFDHNMQISWGKIAHYIGLYQAPDDPTTITCIVVFEHEHCKLKSAEFIVNSEKSKLCIPFSKLPLCFKETEELTVTVELHME